MTEVQDRTGKKVKKRSMKSVDMHDKLLKTEMFDGIKLLRKREVLQLNICLWQSIKYHPCLYKTYCPSNVNFGSLLSYLL